MNTILLYNSNPIYDNKKYAKMMINCNNEFSCIGLIISKDTKEYNSIINIIDS